MHRTEGANYVEIGGKKYFTDGPPGTTVTDDWLNAVQEEIAGVVEAAGLTLETAGTETRDQLQSALDVYTAAPAILDNIYPSKSTKVADYSVLTGDFGSIIELGALNAADRTFTLPAVVEANDGLVLRFLNNSYYNLTIKPNSSSTNIWNSGKGYGLDLPEKGTYVAIRYNHDNTKWDIIGKTGGRVMIEGLKLHEPMTSIGARATGSSANLRNSDLSGRHAFYSSGDLTCVEDNLSVFSTGCYYFDGTGDFLQYPDSPDWDIFSTQTGHKTIAFWVYFDTNGSDEAILGHYEDANNVYYIYRKNADNSIQFYYRKGGVDQMNISGGTALIGWHHIAVIIDGVSVGVYLNGVQVAYDGAWDTDTFAGSFYVGDNGGSTFLDGRMQDLFIACNNPFNAAPNVGVTDDWSANLPDAPMLLVM